MLSESSLQNDIIHSGHTLHAKLGNSSLPDQNGRHFVEDISNFQMYLHEWNVVHFDLNSTEVCS